MLVQWLLKKSLNDPTGLPAAARRRAPLDALSRAYNVEKMFRDALPAMWECFEMLTSATAATALDTDAKASLACFSFSS
jgi:hypothetical protein